MGLLLTILLNFLVGCLMLIWSKFHPFPALLIGLGVFNFAFAIMNSVFYAINSGVLQ